VLLIHEFLACVLGCTTVSQLEDALLRLHAGRFGKDDLELRVELEGTIAAGEAVLAGEIVDPREPDSERGDIRRRYLPSDDGYAAEVWNAGLGLPKRYQGRGFNSALSAQVEAGYKQLGIRFIRLTAGRDAGGVVWASTYDFDDGRLRGFGEPTTAGSGVGAGGEHVRLPQEGSRHQLRLALVRAIADAALASARITEDERSALEPVLERLVVPAMVLRLPEGLGKRLLRGSRWPGIRDLGI
jgi:hypothetical protein